MPRGTADRKIRRFSDTQGSCLRSGSFNYHQTVFTVGCGSRARNINYAQTRENNELKFTQVAFLLGLINNYFKFICDNELFFLLSCQKKKKTVSCFLHWYLLKTVRWMDGSIWPPATNRCVSPMLFCVFLQILTVEVFRLRNKFHSNRQTRASSHNIPSLRIPVAMVIHVVVIFLFGAACSQLTTDFCKYTVGRLR